MKYKLKDGQLIPFQNPAHILGDASKYAQENGYKEVIYREGDKGTYEDENYIYVETPPPAPLTNDDIRLLRQQAYEAESDSLYMAWQKYLAFNEHEKAELSKVAWLAKIEEIAERYPYIV